jgi:DNA processing protein
VWPDESAEPAALPDEAWLLALSALPHIGPRRLLALTSDWAAEEAFGRLRHRDSAALALLDARSHATAAEVASAAQQLDVASLWQRHAHAGINVAGRASPDYPAALVDDPDPPAVLCWRGDIASLGGAAVAIVGTRRCSRYGHDVARELGAMLAAAGVAVVSGLALGIDAAAHEGALASNGAPPIGVVGCGLDVVYPRRNRALWDRVGAEGLLLSEVPLGVGPTRWRFPARNRIIAALAPVVVVVESHAEGGSLHTVREALARDRVVMAVPGPMRAATSLGTNRLIADGAIAVCELTDVLLAVGMACPPTLPVVAGSDRSEHLEAGGPSAVNPLGQRILATMGWEPTTPDHVMLILDLDPLECLDELGRLEAEGLIAWRGPFVERVAGGPR